MRRRHTRLIRFIRKKLDRQSPYKYTDAEIRAAILATHHDGMRMPMAIRLASWRLWSPRTEGLFMRMEDK